MGIIRKRKEYNVPHKIKKTKSQVLHERKYNYVKYFLEQYTKSIKYANTYYSLQDIYNLYCKLIYRNAKTKDQLIKVQEFFTPRTLIYFIYYNFPEYKIDKYIRDGVTSYKIIK